MRRAEPPARSPLRFVPAATWAGLLWFASSFDWRKLPWRRDDEPGWWLLDWLTGVLPPWLPWDKALHALIFGLLAALLRAPSRLPARRAALLAIALATAWGVVDELHQATVPGRSADPWDVLADLIGAALAVAALALWRRSRPAAQRPTAFGPQPTSGDDTPQRPLAQEHR